MTRQTELQSHRINTIFNTSFTGSDTVEITCSQNVSTGDTLYYGISLAESAIGGSHNRGNRGNLCDSQGDLYTTQVVNDADSQLTTVALNNYCYSFYEELIV